MKTYIHYGHDKLDRDAVTHVVTSIKSKPNKGVWASPVDSTRSWKDWCEAEDFRVCEESNSFTFTLSPDAKILEVHEESDIMDYVIFNEVDYTSRRFSATHVCDMLNLPKLYRDFDGMELFLSEGSFGFHLGLFSLWDCDSIVVWNPDVIVT